MQQINLYQPQQNQSSSAQINFKHALLGILVVIIVLSGLSIQQWLSIEHIKKQTNVTQQQLQESETTLQLIQIEYPPQKIDQQLKNEINRSHILRNELNTAVNLLNNPQSDKNEGFSRYLSALARQHIPTIWFTRIFIDSNTQELTLQGHSFKASPLPQLLQKLKNEAVFHGKHFTQLAINQNKNKDSPLQFTISTHTEEMKKQQQANKNE